MLDNREIAEEILRRMEIVKKMEAARAVKRKRIIYTALIAAACLALLVALSFLIWANAPDASTAVTHGIDNSMFDRAVVGGYVLITIIGFSLGTVPALFWYKWKGEPEIFNRTGCDAPRKEG